MRTGMNRGMRLACTVMVAVVALAGCKGIGHGKEAITSKEGKKSLAETTGISHYLSRTTYESKRKTHADVTEVLLSKGDNRIGVYRWSPAETAGITGWIDTVKKDNVLTGTLSYKQPDTGELTQEPIKILLEEYGIFILRGQECTTKNLYNGDFIPHVKIDSSHPIGTKREKEPEISLTRLETRICQDYHSTETNMLREDLRSSRMKVAKLSKKARRLEELLSVSQDNFGELQKAYRSSSPKKQDIKKILSDKRISLFFTETPLSEVLAFIKTIVDVDLIMDLKEGVDPPITVRVKQMTFKTVLDWIAELSKTEWEIKGQAIRFAAGNP